MNKRPPLRRRVRGLTLIELMIALAIGSMLMVGAMGLFISNKRIYREQDAMGRLQENALFALNLLIDDIRMAGYVGGSHDATTVTNTLTGSGTATNLFSFADPIEGSESAANWVPSGSTEVKVADPNCPPGQDVDGDGDIDAPVCSMLPSTDGITLRYLAPLTNQVEIDIASDDPDDPDDLAPVAGPVLVDCPVTSDCTTVVLASEPIAISDFASTDIFSVTAVASGSLAHTGTNLSKAYGSATQVSRYVTNRYYIGIGADVNGDGTLDREDTPSLFRYTYAQDKDDVDDDDDTDEFIAHSQELIEGVDGMQILYGLDNVDADPNDNINPDRIADTYVTAPASAADWSNVVSVRLALLLRTVNEDKQGGDVDTRTYDLLYKAAAPTLGARMGPFNDFRRRRVYTATVQIRNRSI